MLKPKRKVKCDVCREYFERWNSFTKVCKKPECIIENAKRQKKKDKRKAVKKFNEKDRSYMLTLAQKTVNRYIRIRDKNEPCISCNTPKGYRQEAGHYRSSGNNSAVRFNTLNIWSQCHKCNCKMSANLVPYRESLINKLGLEKVEWLEAQTHPVKYDLDYLHRLIRIFRRKIKLYENRFR